jgi:Tol biopolymer transport system component
MLPRQPPRSAALKSVASAPPYLPALWNFLLLATAVDFTALRSSPGREAGSPPERHASFPSASPDGRHIAFASSRGAEVPAGASPWYYMHIFVMDADGSHVRQLTNGVTSDTAPVWTPDGHWIVFGAIDRHSQHETLNLIHPDGSGLHNIMSGDFLPWVRVTSDGQRVLFTETEADVPAGVFSLRLDGTDKRAVATGVDHAWDGMTSPDGRLVVFSRWPARAPQGHKRPTEVYLSHADGAGRRLLATYPDLIQVPSWSPDGRRIAYQTYTGAKGEADIVVLEVDTGTFQLLSHRDAAYLDETPNWTPDGRILFQSTRSGRFEVYVMDADGSHVRSLTATAGDPR